VEGEEREAAIVRDVTDIAVVVSAIVGAYKALFVAACNGNGHNNLGFQIKQAQYLGESLFQ
jgi:hypothetical protein